MRIALHAREMHRFPLLADDEVHQFLLEEGLMARLRSHEEAEAEKAARAAAVAAAERRVADQRARIRQQELMH